ncbi:MAG: ABC1 kinase family protein [Pyrinomonadaceae bacterium]
MTIEHELLPNAELIADRMLLQYKRLVEVSLHLAWFAAQFLIHYVFLRRGPAALGRLAGQHFRALGGGYIKLAQALALRRDVFTEGFCHELAQARDEVVPFDNQIAQDIIKKEFGRPSEELFFCLDKLPTVADSFAQRYNGVLKTGEPVIIKVQRPGSKRLAEADLLGIRFLLKVIDFSGIHGRVGLSRDYQAFRTNMLEGLSYLAEARYVERFAAQTRNNSRELIPQVYWSHTTDAVLTIERLEGISLSKVLDVIASAQDPLVISESFEGEGIDLLQAAENLIYGFLNQLFNGKYFHRDLRPADLIIMEGNVIGYLDFVSVGRMDQKFAQHQLDFLYAARGGDVDALYEVVLEYFEPPFDTDLVTLEDVFKSRISRWLEASDDEYSPVEESSFVAHMKLCMDDFRRLQIPVPGTILACYKAFAAVDEVILTMAPELDVKVAWAGFFRETLTARVQKQINFDTLSEVFLEYEALMLTLPRQLRASMRQLRRGHYPVVRIVSKGDLRGWKFMRALATSLILAMVVARVWLSFYPTARLRELSVLLSPAAFWGSLVGLIFLRRIFSIRYESAARGNYRMRLP